MQVETESKLLFWQSESIYSNWYQPIEFSLDGILFTNSEACFMYLKALLFKDTQTANEILKNQDPRGVKAYGRNIKNFDQKLWDEEKENLMFRACFSKFSQNAKLLEALVDTGTKELVEASPFDTIWGIGLGPNDPKALDKSQWKGLNLLGMILMDIRYIFQKQSEE